MILLFLVAITYLNPYGASFQYGIVLYPVLTILLAIISKMVFKKCFDPFYWIIFFIMSMVFSVIAFGLFLLGAYADTIAPLLNMGYVEADQSMGYFMGAMMLNFGSFVFLICYLINFLIRLVRHKRLKKEENLISE